MTQTLDTAELIRLVRKVFRPGPDDRTMALFFDLPDERLPDTEEWAARRALVTHGLVEATIRVTATSLEWLVVSVRGGHCIFQRYARPGGRPGGPLAAGARPQRLPPLAAACRRPGARFLQC